MQHLSGFLASESAGEYLCAMQVLKEKVYRRMYKEVPYEAEIEDVSVKTLTDGSLRIEKNLIVPSEQVHSAMLICVAQYTKTRSLPAAQCMCRGCIFCIHKQ